MGFFDKSGKQLLLKKLCRPLPQVLALFPPKLKKPVVASQIEYVATKKSHFLFIEAEKFLMRRSRFIPEAQVLDQFLITSVLSTTLPDS